MKTKIIEVTNGPQNWAKLMLGQFDDSEWSRRSSVSAGEPIVRGRGWSANSTLVLDLQTGEGAIFMPGGLASADLARHRIWVCPLFEPFLTWLYTQARFVHDGLDLDALPDHVVLPDAPFAFAGHRRPGPPEVEPPLPPVRLATLEEMMLALRPSYRCNVPMCGESGVCDECRKRGAR